MAEHDGVRIPGTDLRMPEPAVILQHRMEAACLQIAVNDAAVRLRLTGNRKKVPVCPLLLLRQGIPACLHNGKETVVLAHSPVSAVPALRNAVYTLSFQRFQGKLPDRLLLLVKNMLIIRRNQSAVIVQPFPFCQLHGITRCQIHKIKLTLAVNFRTIQQMRAIRSRHTVIKIHMVTHMIRLREPHHPRPRLFIRKLLKPILNHISCRHLFLSLFSHPPFFLYSEGCIK